MPFSRNAAIQYARDRWDHECDDGIFYLSNEAVSVAERRLAFGAPARRWAFRFVPDGDGGERAIFRDTHAPASVKIVQEWDGLADCAHFLSRCITAGGVHVNTTSVPTLVDILRNMPAAVTKTLGEQLTRDQGQNVIDSGVFQPGDMIAFFNISPQGDYGGARQYSHSAMYVGQVAGTGGGPVAGRVTCHTKCRFGGLTPTEISDVWHLDSTDYTYTFIHFASDDAPLGLFRDNFSGWWRLDGPGTVYQYVDANGTSTFTSAAPKSAHDRPHGTESAYWFAVPMPQSGAIFIWGKTGTVDVWQPAEADGTFDVTTNRLTRRLATRLF